MIENAVLVLLIVSVAIVLLIFSYLGAILLHLKSKAKHGEKRKKKWRNK